MQKTGMERDLQGRARTSNEHWWVGWCYLKAVPNLLPFVERSVISLGSHAVSRTEETKNHHEGFKFYLSLVHPGSPWPFPHSSPFFISFLCLLCLFFCLSSERKDCLRQDICLQLSLLHLRNPKVCLPFCFSQDHAYPESCFSRCPDAVGLGKDARSSTWAALQTGALDGGVGASRLILLCSWYVPLLSGFQEPPARDSRVIGTLCIWQSWNYLLQFSLSLSSSLSLSLSFCLPLPPSPPAFRAPGLLLLHRHKSQRGKKISVSRY